MEIKIINLHVDIKTQPNKVWSVLTSEREFSKCFNGLQIKVGDLKKDGEILFLMNGSDDVDTAKITFIDAPKTLSYYYYKSKSTDCIEMSFKISSVDDEVTKVSLAGENFKDKEEFEHSKITWKGMLERMKSFLES